MPTYSEFNDPRLVAIYDTVNPIDEYQAFYVDLATQLSATLIIDIGCGSGLLTHALSEQGHEMIGVEPSGAMLDLAKQRDYSGRVRWIKGGAIKLGECDAVLAIMTGHVAQFHLEEKDWREALEAIYRSLKSGGHIAFESRNPLVPPFESWPTKNNHRRLEDAKAGKIEWWVEDIQTTGNRVSYTIHYLFIDSGEEVLSAKELVFRSREEIEKSLEDAGFTVQNVYGDWDRTSVNEDSPELIFVAERK